MRTVHRELEAEAWKLAADFLTPTQQADLRPRAARLAGTAHGRRDGSIPAFREFVNVMPSKTRSRPRPSSSLIGLVASIPMPASIPAVRQVEQSRLARRAGHLLRAARAVHHDLQLDRSLNRIAVDPDTARCWHRPAASARRRAFRRGGEALPDEFSKERGALIRQLSELLSNQQAILLPMLVELRAALEAGNLTADLGGRSRRSIDAWWAAQGPPGRATPGRRSTSLSTRRRPRHHAVPLSNCSSLIGSLDRRPGNSAPRSSRRWPRPLVIDYLFVRAHG